MAQWTRGRHELDRPGTTRRYEALTNASGDRTDSVITMLRADTTEFLTEDEFQIAMARLDAQFAEQRAEFRTEIHEAFSAQTRTLVIGLITAVVLVALTHALAIVAA